MDEEEFEQLVAYYTFLLIIQYAGPGQPNAQANITLLAEVMLAAGVYFDVENAYNIDPDLGPTAVGVQLDVIGKYVGVNRFYSAIDLADYFAMVTASEHSSLPSSPPAFGFSTAATFMDFDYNGTLTCQNITTSSNALSDADFLTLIQFLILTNNMNYSAASIDAALWQIFGASVRAETNGNMAMTYFLISPISTLVATVVFKKLLPAPMAVLINIVENIGALTFGMVSCLQVSQNIYSSFAFGFSTCSNYDSLPGEMLTCSQISQG